MTRRHSDPNPTHCRHARRGAVSLKSVLETTVAVIAVLAAVGSGCKYLSPATQATIVVLERHQPHSERSPSALSQPVGPPIPTPRISIPPPVELTFTTYLIKLDYDEPNVSFEFKIDDVGGIKSESWIVTAEAGGKIQMQPPASLTSKERVFDVTLHSKSDYARLDVLHLRSIRLGGSGDANGVKTGVGGPRTAKIMTLDSVSVTGPPTAGDVVRVLLHYVWLLAFVLALIFAIAMVWRMIVRGRGLPTGRARTAEVTAERKDDGEDG